MGIGPYAKTQGAGGGTAEGQQQLRQGGLAGAGAADDGDPCPGLDPKVQIRQRRQLAAGIGEADVVQRDLPGEGPSLGGTVVLQARGLRHLAQTPGRHPHVGQHDDGEGHGNDGPQDDVDVLDHGEDVAGGQTAPPLHPDAAQIDDQKGGGVQHKGRHGVDHGHGHVGPDDVVGHDPGGVGDLLMGLPFPVKGPDHPDAPEPLPDQVVLPVAVFVGDLPKVVDLFAQKEHPQDQQGHHAEDDQRQPEVLPHTQKHAAQEHQRYDDEVAAEHGDHPVQGAHVVGGTGD